MSNTHTAESRGMTARNEKKIKGGEMKEKSRGHTGKDLRERRNFLEHKKPRDRNAHILHIHSCTNAQKYINKRRTMHPYTHRQLQTQAY